MTPHPHAAMRPISLLFLTPLLATAAPVADFEAALAAAKSAQAPIAVFLHGSDWNPAGETMLKTWQDPRIADAAGPATPLVTIDRMENPDQAATEAAKRNAKCDPPVRSLPAVAFYDADGRLVSVRSGLPEIESSGGLPATLKGMRSLLAKRDELWKRATSEQGPKRAALLGAGLDLMNQGLGPKNLYQNVLNDMKQADPKDESGYIGKYTFSPWSLLDLVLEKVKAGDPAAAEAELDRWNRVTRLDKRQRQELHATRFALYQRWPQKKEMARKSLEDMRAVDPGSDLGKAAESYLKQLKD